MQSYGKFQAVRELYQTPLGAVWAGRPVGEDGPASACIKLIQPESAVFEGGGVESAKQMLVAAAIQQSVASQAENWAPIYELGYDGQTAFYVTQLYERSLQRLVAAKAKLTSSQLLTITSAIVDGLLSLDEVHHRPHGNLKPSNVLLSGRGRIRPESVVLTDPYPGDPEVPSATRSPDAKALGEILFSLVTGRPYTAARWPVAASVEWDRLGSSGRQWLQLCNDLLNTMARDGMLSLEEIQLRLNHVRRGRRQLPRRGFAIAAMIGLVACGYVYRQDVGRAFDQVKTQIVKKFPATQPATVHQPVVADVPRLSPHAVIIPTAVPNPAPAEVVRVPDPTAVQPPPVSPPPLLPLPISPLSISPAPASTTPVSPPPVPVSQSSPVVVEPKIPVVVLPPPEMKPPAFLPAGAAAKFSKVLANRPDQENIRTNVAALEQLYPKPAISGRLDWQIKLQALAMARWETALTQAISALAEGKDPDASPYRVFVDSVEKYNREATQAQASIELGTPWRAENWEQIQGAIADRINLFDDSVEGIEATPPVLEEIRRISKSQDEQTLSGVLHDATVLPAVRAAAWQRLCDPRLNISWASDRRDFIAGQSDGDAVIKSSDLTPSVKQVISQTQDLRLRLFYSTLTTPALLTDAMEHVTEIEAGRTAFRPVWFDYDLALSKLKTDGGSSIGDLLKFKTAADLPELAALQSAMVKVSAVASVDQPLDAVGPCVLKDWVVRAGRSGCTYTCENFPSVEFIRVEPSGKPGCTSAFYLSTTNVTIELVAALLDRAGPAGIQSNLAFRHLNLVDQSPPPAGARTWKVKDPSGIELNPDGYNPWFPQGTADLKLPIQQITPQAAVYLARTMGSRLPTSAEWQAAWAMASNSADPRMKRFATSALKLRDADFTALVQKAAQNSANFPDEGAFMGAGSASIPSGAKAQIWPVAKVQQLGGWTLADRSTDLGREKIAEMGTISDDLDADLLEPPQRGFRPVGNAQGVFHDLVGNVAEFVVDAAVGADQLPAGEPLQEKQIIDWFNQPGKLQQFGVIGGSFLSPPELDPRLMQKLPRNLPQPMFSDVGFRLAFTDPREFIDPVTVIRNAAFAYPPQKAKILDNAH